MPRLTALAALPLALGIAACGQTSAPSGPEPARAADAAAPGPVQVGEASYYASELAGRPTASGEPLKPEAMTAASRSLPLGTDARVTNTETGRSVVVEVNDRGPYAKNRIIDVTPKAAERLGMKADGAARVVVQPLPADAVP
ncbi:MAG: septal ring lytic transglycosylase RlpA family protein [Phenylobacterium sp.]|uniref:septal ring lytic transglycosylase RlpA family protein n=1 Tax=Phenylobacterium sp. TaxID=1871053 RepID=UPI001A508BD2|nr:septal ring lytic transglycosylase RlpA family protein [Phenylobacterium sp.]MBL8771450.1 septal ring lytic transglycosylase RlpA family protein [Phenylobacterium sp.]